MFTKCLSIVLCVTLVGALTPSWAESPVTGKLSDVDVVPPTADILASPGEQSPSGRPALASPGDSVARTLLARHLIPPRRLALSAASTMPAYRFDDPSQVPASGQYSGKGKLTGAGKLSKWVGVGLMATGGIGVAYGLSVGNACGDYDDCGDCGETRRFYVASGAVTAGVGALLYMIGIKKKQ
jgi:hypothetical protein